MKYILGSLSVFFLLAGILEVPGAKPCLANVVVDHQSDLSLLLAKMNEHSCCEANPALEVFGLSYSLTALLAPQTLSESKKGTPKPDPTPTVVPKSSSRKGPIVKKNGTNRSQTTPPAKTVTNVKKAGSGKQSSTATRTSKPKALPAKQTTEKEEFEKATAIESPSEKVAALKQFLEKFPASSKKNEVLESITVLRIQLGQDELKAANTESGIALLRSAILEMPVPVRDELFNGSIVKIPGTLYFNGQRTEAVEIAALIEDKVGGNADQLLGLAAFYLGIESGIDAKRLAEKAVAISPGSGPGFQTLGLSARLNFDLDEAEKGYTKALELEPESLPTLRALAELKRAQGRADEAIELYQRILAKDAANLPAESGLVLSMFDAGKRSEAEAELSRSLEQNPNNVILLAGVAYWYAAHNEPEKAIDYARSAIEKEPRYIWSHIALARGFLARKQPAAAEEVLLKARQFGNFPTLEYELASARIMSGFFRDAADELRKSFMVKDGVIHTRLGGRVDHEDTGFVELLANERRASIFEPVSADDAETAARLKSLLEFDQAVNLGQVNEDVAAKTADAFVAGDDKMKLHRELYAASTLLAKRLALTKVLEYAKSAVDNTDDGFDVPDPGAAIMASELYDSRAIALARNELIKVPEVPRATLSAIMRGRVEEIAGWSLYNQDQPAEAIVRLRRAVSVMPAKSSWWRSSMWKLGAALQADGKDKEALDAYIKSYSIDKPDVAKYVTVEALYKKLNGNTEGLEKKIGLNPQPIAVQPAETSGVVAQKDTSTEPKPEASPTPDVSVTAEAREAAIKTEPSPTPATSVSPATTTSTPEATPAPQAELKPEPTPASLTTPTPEPTPTPKSEVMPTPAPEQTPTPETSSTPIALATPTPTAEITPEPTPVATPTPEPSSTPTTSTTPTPNAEVSPTPTATVTPTPEPSSTPVALAVPTPDPKAATTPTTENAQITPSATPADSNATASKPPLESPIKDPGSNNPEGTKQGEIKAEDTRVASSDNSPKPLFEPVIITVPGATVKRALTDLGAKRARDLSGINESKTSSDSASSGNERPRIIAGKDIKVVDPPTCSISVSQESISILSKGGSLGILVRLEGKGDLRSVKATADSPDDLQIKLEPEIAGLKGQAFYLIRSVTAKTGNFKVLFAAQCGSKEVAVTVR